MYATNRMVRRTIAVPNGAADPTVLVGAGNEGFLNGADRTVFAIDTTGIMGAPLPLVGTLRLRATSDSTEVFAPFTTFNIVANARQVFVTTGLAGHQVQIDVPAGLGAGFNAIVSFETQST